MKFRHGDVDAFLAFLSIYNVDTAVDVNGSRSMNAYRLNAKLVIPACYRRLLTRKHQARPALAIAVASGLNVKLAYINNRHQWTTLPVGRGRTKSIQLLRLHSEFKISNIQVRPQGAFRLE